MDRHEALRLAGEAVTARQTNYGTPEDNFKRIARRWNAHLDNLRDRGGIPVLTGADVAMMMCDVKLARLANDPTHADSWVDVVGYGACGAEVGVEQKTPRGPTVAQCHAEGDRDITWWRNRALEPFVDDVDPKARSVSDLYKHAAKDQAARDANANNPKLPPLNYRGTTE